MTNMKLSDARSNGLLGDSVTIVRDGEFAALGYVTHKINTKPFLAFAGNQGFLNKALENPLVSCIITSQELADAVPAPIGVMVSPDPMRTFYQLHHALIDRTELYWKPFETIIEPGARVSPDARIAKHNVRIGSGAVIEEGAIIKEKSIIGNEVVIRSNCVVGSEGFEYKRFDDKLVLVRHAHGVDIRDGAQIHAACMFDRGLFGDPTTVGEGSCLDNLVHVAHGVQIGRNVIIAANVVFAAAVIVRDEARIDPNATIAHEKEIGAGAYVSLGAVVTKDVPPNTKVSGNFAYEHSRFLRNVIQAARD